MNTQQITRRKKHQKPDLEQIKEFWEAPIEAFFSEAKLAPVIGCSVKTLQCNRWRKSGIPFRKVSGRVLYKKADVIAWLESHPIVHSTSEYKRGE